MLKVCLNTAHMHISTHPALTHSKMAIVLVRLYSAGSELAQRCISATPVSEGCGSCSICPVPVMRLWSSLIRGWQLEEQESAQGGPALCLELTLGSIRHPYQLGCKGRYEKRPDMRDLSPDITCTCCLHDSTLSGAHIQPGLFEMVLVADTQS